MTPIDSLTQTLRTSGYSATATRRALFAALQNQKPMSMHALLARLPQIDRASVYRNIALFEQLGIVQRLQAGWKYKLELTGSFHEHHHHATCLSCGRSTDLPEDELLEARLHTLAKQYHFQVRRHQIELQGLCGQCSQTPPV